MTAAPVVSEVRHELGGRAVGEGQERRVDLGQIGADGQLGRGEVRVVVTDRLVLAVAAGEPDDLDVRMPAQQPDQLAAAVAGRADDPDTDASRAIDAGHAPLGTRDDPRRPVRRDRRGRPESCAHGRTKPFAEG